MTFRRRAPFQPRQRRERSVATNSSDAPAIAEVSRSRLAAHSPVGLARPRAWRPALTPRVEDPDTPTSRGLPQALEEPKSRGVEFETAVIEHLRCSPPSPTDTTQTRWRSLLPPEPRLGRRALRRHADSRATRPVLARRGLGAHAEQTTLHRYFRDRPLGARAARTLGEIALELDFAGIHGDARARRLAGIHGVQCRGPGGHVLRRRVELE